MKIKLVANIIILLTFCMGLNAQHISELNSLEPNPQNTNLILPSTHSFQYIIETGDALTEGGTLPDNCDFAGYVPINNSSKLGYLSINSESAPGGVTILDIELDESIGKWITNRSEGINFSSVVATIANCSGTVTPWNTIITCEEYTSIELNIENPIIPTDSNVDGYHDFGWAIEIDPVTKTVIDQDGGLTGADKLWAMGNFKHENAVIHGNHRTVYQGADATNGDGYLFKFVADIQENLGAGKLYVFKEITTETGEWIQLNNSSQSDQNSTIAQCKNVGATSFLGIEDVEINPIDNKVYFAVKRDGKVYRFRDSDPIIGTTITEFETYVGGMSYNIGDGPSPVVEPWGTGNDNLVFDDLGNLWVAQDGNLSNGDNNYIWIVENGHTQLIPKVKIFARTPSGSEPTGLTFSPDYRYLFLSIQHPEESNNITSQLDGFDIPRKFDRDVSIMIARKEFINQDLTALSVNSEADPFFKIYPNPAENKVIVAFDQLINTNNILLFDALGRRVHFKSQSASHSVELNTDHLSNGIYFIKVLIENNWMVEKLSISR